MKESRDGSPRREEGSQEKKGGERMAVFCILNWLFPFEDLSLVIDEDGNPLLFDSKEEAKEYAEDNLNFKWKVVGLD
jgi:hypothetical protein